MATKRQPWSAEQKAWLASAVRQQNTPGLSNDAVAGNEGEDRLNSGIFGTIFDILSRPSSAVASGVLATQTGDDPIAAIGKALAGTERHNFADVLGEAGVSGPARAIGGFAGDVLLDPLTYVGVKGVKGVTQTEATAEAVRALDNLGLDKLNFTDNAVRREATRIQAQNPSHLYVTFAGKKVGPDFVRPGEVANTVKDAIIGPPEARKGIARALSIESELPEGLAAKSRVYESQSQSYFEDHKRTLAEVFNDLNPDERTLITRAMEAGETLHGTPLQNGIKRDGMNTLGHYQDLARTLMDDYFDDEVTMGLRKAEQKSPNYIPKLFRSGLPEEQPGLSRIATGAREGFKGNPATNMPLAQAERLGLDPVMDIGELLQERSASHYRQIGRARLYKDAVDTFGVEMTPGNEQYLLSNGWRRADVAAPDIYKPLFKGQNRYVPEHIIRSLNQTERLLTDNQLGGEFVRWYDKLTQKWKFLNTVVNPGYWIRNSISDGLQNFADGVRDPRYYDQAFKVLGEHRASTTDELISRVTGAAPAPIETGKIRLGGVDYNARQIYEAYLQSGAKSGQIQTEITPSLNRFEREGIGRYLDKTKQVAGQGQTAWKRGELGIADANNYREDVFRMAHFLSAMEDELPKVKNWDKAVANAGSRVRKFNIDYGSLSTFERNKIRRVVPFYGWMRRNLPLQVQLLFTRPGFMAAYPKGQDLMQGLLGTDDGEGDYMVPKWIRESMPVRIALGNNKSSNPLDMIIRKMSGAEQGESVFLPLGSSMTPMGDLSTLTRPVQDFMDANPLESPGRAAAAFAQGLGAEAVNTTTPFIKAPVELATGRNLYTGAPIDNWLGWATGQISPGRQVNNAVSGNTYGLTSWATGVQTQPVTEARQAGEFRRREDVLQGYQARYGGTRALQWKNYLSQARRSVGA